MRETEQTAKTVEEAIQQGLQILGIERDEAQVEVLEEPASGLFGIGAKQARVRLVVKEANVEEAQKVLEDILKLLDLQAVVDVVKNEDVIRFEVSGEDLGVLIGYRGATLDALQFFVNHVLWKGVDGKKSSCVLDVEGYRARRERALQILAEKMAQRVSTERRSIALEPMHPNERRIIHMALRNNPYVTTSSQGRDPMRKVVISPKDGGKERKKSFGRPSRNGNLSPSRSRFDNRGNRFTSGNRGIFRDHT